MVRLLLGGDGPLGVQPQVLADTKNKVGQLALHFAALGGDQQCFDALQFASPGSNNVPDKRGRTASQAVARRGLVSLGNW